MLARGLHAARPRIAGPEAAADACVDRLDRSQRLERQAALLVARHPNQVRGRDRLPVPIEPDVTVRRVELDPGKRCAESLLTVGEIAVHRGDWRRACSDLEELANEETDAHARLQVQRRVIEALSRVGGRVRSAKVLGQVRAAQASADAADCPRCAADLPVEAAEALARVGLIEEADRLLRSTEASGPTDRPRSLLRAWVEALVASERGRPDGVALL